MKKIVAVMTGIFLVVAGFNAQAIDVRVKGFIVPASCSFTLVNAVIDYGTIDPQLLSATNYTTLEAKSTPPEFNT